MGLVGATNLVYMANQFRVIWIMGRYGGGKTSLAYLLADALFKTGKYRYLLSNSRSVWTDNPENVVLRDDKHVDAVVLLDEGGLFLRTGADADAFLLGLRKLNITLVIPSVLQPASKVKFLQVQRIMTMQPYGIPAWLYEYRLNYGSQNEKSKFWVWKPDCIWGIYDTFDYPDDDKYLSDWLDYWISQAQDAGDSAGWAKWGRPPGYDGDDLQSTGKRKRKRAGSMAGMEAGGRYVEEVQEIADNLEQSLSVHAKTWSTKKR